MNIFEGARRISKIIAVLATAGTVAAAMLYKPYLSSDYVYDPDKYLKPVGSCNYEDQRYHPKVVGLPNVSITVCGYSTGPSEVELAEDEFNSLSYEVTEKKAAYFKDKAGWLLAFLGVGWALTWAIGWIVRGFMGIPSRQDYKNSSPTLQK